MISPTQLPSLTKNSLLVPACIPVTYNCCHNHPTHTTAIIAADSRYFDSIFFTIFIIKIKSIFLYLEPMIRRYQSDQFSAGNGGATCERKYVYRSCGWLFLFVFCIWVCCCVDVCGGTALAVENFMVADALPPFRGRQAEAAAFSPYGPSVGASLMIAGGVNFSTFIFNDVWTSGNGGVTWTLRSAAAPWKGRTSGMLIAAPLTTGQVEWLLTGGGGAAASEFADLWTSVNSGATWTQRLATTPWGALSQGGFVFSPAGNVAILFGGLDAQMNVHNFVYNSNNGGDWHLLANAPWSPRSGMSVTTGANKVWMAGGILEDLTGLNDVWSTVDGTAWTLVSNAQHSPAPWAGRQFAGLVFALNQLIITGGQLGASLAPTNDAYALDIRTGTWSQVYSTANSPLPATAFSTFLTEDFPTLQITALDTGIIFPFPDTVYHLTPATGTINVTFADPNKFKPVCEYHLWTISIQLEVTVTVAAFGGAAFASAPQLNLLATAFGGMPIFQMSFFQNGAPVEVAGFHLFGTDDNDFTANMWQFQLKSSHNQIGGVFVFQSACNAASAIPTFTAKFSTNDYVFGLGFQNIPVVAAFPNIINALQPINGGGGNGVPATTTLPPFGTSTPPAPIIVTIQIVLVVWGAGFPNEAYIVMWVESELLPMIANKLNVPVSWIVLNIDIEVVHQGGHHGNANHLIVMASSDGSSSTNDTNWSVSNSLVIQPPLDEMNTTAGALLNATYLLAAALNDPTSDISEQLLAQNATVSSATVQLPTQDQQTSDDSFFQTTWHIAVVAGGAGLLLAALIIGAVIFIRKNHSLNRSSSSSIVQQTNEGKSKDNEKENAKKLASTDSEKNVELTLTRSPSITITAPPATTPPPVVQKDTKQTEPMPWPQHPQQLASGVGAVNANHASKANGHAPGRSLWANLRQPSGVSRVGGVSVSIPLQVHIDGSAPGSDCDSPPLNSVAFHQDATNVISGGAKGLPPRGAGRSIRPSVGGGSVGGGSVRGAARSIGSVNPGAAAALSRSRSGSPSASPAASRSPSASPCASPVPFTSADSDKDLNVLQLPLSVVDASGQQRPHSSSSSRVRL